MGWAVLLLFVAGQVDFPPLEDDLAFVEGKRLYDELEPARAVFKFREALRTEGRPAEDMARIHVWLGLTYAQLGEEAAARQSFTDAFGLWAGVALPGEPSPKVRVLFDDTWRSMTGAPPLASEADPPEASGSAAPAEPIQAVEPAAAAEPIAPPPPAEPAPNVEPDPAAEVSPPAPTEESPAQGNAAWMIGASGAGVTAVALAGVGAVFGAQALTIQSAANQPDVTQVDARAARDEATVSSFLANGLYLGAATATLAAVGLAVVYFVADP